jgi:hypothetical protein
LHQRSGDIAVKSQLTIFALAFFLGGCASGKITPSAFLNEKRGLQGDFRRIDTVHVGDMAPDFKLKTLDGKRTVRLGQFKGKRPVVLIFGSYT